MSRCLEKKVVKQIFLLYLKFKFVLFCEKENGRSGALKLFAKFTTGQKTKKKQKNQTNSTKKASLQKQIISTLLFVALSVQRNSTAKIHSKPTKKGNK
jgi:hypothetical protein